MQHILKNEIGNVYGKLTVIAPAQNRRIDKKGNAYWLCRCKCGKQKEIMGNNLRGGRSRSCGCETYKTKSRHPGWKGYRDISGTYFSAIRAGAKIRGITFKISIQYIWKIFLKQNKKCALTGLLLTLPQSSKDRLATASLDRIDSRRSYTKENLQWIHKDLQPMKMDLTQEKFIHYCKLVAQQND